MQPNEIQEIVSRIISDSTFAESLSANPEKTLKDAGVEPTPEIIAALKGLDKSAIQRLAVAFNSPTGAA
jgi:hypothetical protein